MTPDRGLVAITGANGTIGYASAIHALRTGYRVRCIVRREDAFSSLKNGPSMQPYLNRIEHAIVSDNAIEGAYDSALVGVDYVVHIAGAWPLPHLHPDTQIYEPFIQSTQNIIHAAQKNNTVKRIVFTQAGAGLVDSEVGDTYGTAMQQVLNEHVKPNTAALTYHPPLKSPHQAYCAAKAQCMSYLSSLQSSKSLPFSIIQVIPGTVIGPSEFVHTRAEALRCMDRQTKALLFDDVQPRYAFGFVHVEDCARVHVNALDEASVRSEEVPEWFIAAGTSKAIDGKELWNTAANMVEKKFNDEIEKGVFKMGRDKMPINMPYRVDSGETEKMVFGGDEIRRFEECVEEVARWYLSLPE